MQRMRIFRASHDAGRTPGPLIVILAAFVFAACHTPLDPLKGAITLKLESVRYLTGGNRRNASVSFGIRVRNQTVETAKLYVCLTRLERKDPSTGTFEIVTGRDCRYYQSDNQFNPEPQIASHSDTLFTRTMPVPQSAVAAGDSMRVSVGISFGPPFTPVGFFSSPVFEVLTD